MRDLCANDKSLKASGRSKSSNSNNLALRQMCPKLRIR